jgi:23S rRNA G2445 N2-methylase RlmL
LQFKRSAYIFKNNRNLVLVHYEGDETVYVPVTHGNSKKDNASEYTRTDPSVLKTIEDQVKSGEKNAMEIYRDNISDNSILGIQQGVLNARNVKQVETIVLKVNEQKRISKDDLHNLVLLISLPYGRIYSRSNCVSRFDRSNSFTRDDIIRESAA